MEPFAPAVEDDIPWLQLHAAPLHLWVRAARKAHKDELRCQREIGDPRQVFLAALQLEVMQRYPGQAGLERTLRRTEQIDPHLAQARLIVVGLDGRSLCRFPASAALHASRTKSRPAGPRCRPEMCKAQGRFTEPTLTMQIPEIARASLYFFAVEDLR